MQRPRFLIEEDPPPDPEKEALTDTINLLTPIRAHRLAKREKQWRAQKRILAAAKKELEKREKELLNERASHLLRRDNLITENSHQRISRFSLAQWQLEDQEIVTELSNIRQKIQDLYNQVSLAEQQLSEAKTQLDKSHLENERLHAFKEAQEEIL
ncbi:hypothetical protein [Marinomonas balearica]|uniref:Type III secretion system (T3SS) protein YscO n=1 Tax=Marinomonas balearica TaxID=491947 RepID=A0A4R6M9Q7_9GAMM|nr:hypothetical protein [Marinomonas balearica]TDO98248.1 hypothetical protein DFP79_1889 [Marinomonas balearica]